MVSMIGVNGWCSANQPSGPGRDSVGTKPELRNGSRTRIIGRLLAVSTLSVTMPSDTDSQPTATAVSASRPAAASHSSGPVVGRKPMSTATTNTIAGREHRLDDAADDVPGEHRGPRDRPSSGSGR